MNETFERSDQPAGPAFEEEGKYLTFRLAEEEYGLGILKVKEIIGRMPVTRVPEIPQYFMGVINLRGRVIPVMDLRLRLGMSEAVDDERACIVVVEMEGDSGRITVGVAVDAVSDVAVIRREEIEDAPDFGSKVDTRYILGMAKKEEKVKILLDIDRVIDGDGKNFMTHAA